METVKINQQEISIKEYDSRRVVTFKEIDQVHSRPAGTARAAFNRNKDRFEKDKDYFVLTRDNPMYVKRTLEIPPKGITLITESGYYKLVKVFDDDPAWAVQDMLVNAYFKKKDPVAPPAEQLTLEQAIMPAARMYHGQPVMTFRDLFNMAGLTKSIGHYNLGNEEYFTCGRDYLILSGKELKQFKRDNPDISQHASFLTIIYLPAVVKLCKKLGVKFNPDKFKQLPAPQAKSSELKHAQSPSKERKTVINDLRDMVQALHVLLKQMEFWNGSEEYCYPFRNAAWILAASIYRTIYDTGPVMKHNKEQIVSRN